MADGVLDFAASDSVPVVPARLDSRTGAAHAALVSAISRLAYEHLCATQPVKPLVEIATISAGSTPSTSRPDYWEGDVPWIAPRDMKTFLFAGSKSSTTKAAVSAGAVRMNAAPFTILVTRGMILARYVPVVHVAVDAATNQDVRVCKSNGLVSGGFLSAMLLGAERRMFSVVTDSTAGQRRIESFALEQTPIPLLDDPAQQDAIATFVAQVSESMTALERSIEHTPRQLMSLKGSFKKLLLAAVKLQELSVLRSQVIEGTSEVVRRAEIEIWPDAMLEGAPSLEEVTSFLGRGRQSAQGESTHFLIKSQHVQLGEYVPTKLTLALDVAAKVALDARTNRGDTLIACSAAGCLGRVCFYDVEGVEASTDTHVAIARPDRDKLLPEYLYAYLRGAQGQHQLRSRERSDWTKEKISFRLAELNQADLRRVPVPLPPIEQQRKIVAHVGRLYQALDAALDAQREQAVMAQSLFNSVVASLCRRSSLSLTTVAR